MNFNIEQMRGGGSQERTKLTIELGDGSGPPSHVVITQGGVQVGEVLYGKFSNQNDLEDEIQHARRLEWLPKAVRSMFSEFSRNMSFEDHVNPTPKAKREAYFRGMLDAMKCSNEHGTTTEKAMKDHTHAYQHGFDAGMSVANVIHAVEKGG